jgi:broad specificity phosphatase PhoE
VSDILLLRHGQSTWNAEGRAQGWSDAPLSALGRQEAAELAAALSGRLRARVVAASDLRRARDTAAILARGLGVEEVSVDARLRERELGWWSGLTGAEMQSGWPETAKAWRAHALDRPPGGETDASVVARVVTALATLALDAAGKQGVAVVISHGGVISALERSAGMGPSGGHANLTGRWLSLAAESWELGPRFQLGVQPLPGETEGPELETA